MPSGAAFLSHGEYLFERNLPDALPQGAHLIDGPLNPLPIHMGFGADESHFFPVASDDNALPALHIVEDAKEMRFGFGCLNRLHKLTSQID